jgi:putative exosortase-associated protein (TIGR04073 family)
MTSIRQISLPTLFISLLLTQNQVFADDYYQQQLQNEQLLKRQVEMQKKMERARYKRQVGDKALRGAINMVSAPLEIPKNIINTYNLPENYKEGNLIFGVIGGVIKGTFEAAGRIFTGAADIITAPVPTKAVIHPKYVYDDFDRTNAYGQIARLVENPKIEPYVEPAPRPAVVSAPIQDNVGEYSQQTNQNLDSMFKDKMSK